jgi:hypothetical protein
MIQRFGRTVQLKRVPRRQRGFIDRLVYPPPPTPAASRSASAIIGSMLVQETLRRDPHNGHGHLAHEIPLSDVRVWLATGHTDMRKGFDGLALCRSRGGEKALTRLPKKGLLSPGLKNGFGRSSEATPRSRRSRIEIERRALRWRTARLSSCGGAPMPA